MRILHLGSSGLGLGVLDVLGRFEDDEIVHTDDLQEARAHLAESECDWIVCAGFRHILDQADLDRARDTCNVHPSLLPWGRGANPNVWALARGEPAGVSIYRMVAGVDKGPVFAQREVETSFSDTGSDFYLRLQKAAIGLFSDEWAGIRSGSVEPQPQPEGGSYHRVADMHALGQIDLSKPATFGEVINVLRALTFPPYRNAIAETGGRRFHIELHIEEIEDV